MAHIRKGIEGDLPRVLELVKELAAYEYALGEVSNTVQAMNEDGFGENPIFGFFVAEVDDLIVGLSLYYYRYSTWKGRRLYLEDIVVTEKMRGQGIGKMLFETTLSHSLNEKCTGMMWQVLDWNETAISFYKKYNTKTNGEWINCSLEADEIRQILNIA
ncbi:MAG: GNAT family N-acetyltransferase [Cyclobacteriaceae bacterium]|nr:GNAT family N-acetyltransferase [Cyclobacteriaceae bacterium]